MPRRARIGWEMAAGGASAFDPRDSGKVAGWIRLAASAQSGGEWTDWVDVINNNPGVINSARRPAVGASANGLPIASFLTNDAVAVPLIAANNQTTKLGWALWVEVANLGGFNTLLSVSTGTGAASAGKIQLFLNASEAPTVDAYISGANGRRFTATTGITQGAWTWVRLKYDSILGGDANATVYVNGALAGGSYGNLGAGGTLTTLPTVTGNLIIGNINDGSASAALTGNIGPNIFFLNDDLTAAEEAALMSFEMPA